MKNRVFDTPIFDMTFGDLLLLSFCCFAIGFGTGAVILKIQMVTDKQIEECARPIDTQSPGA